MALYVQKFGGTSVGDVNRIQRLAEIVAHTRSQGDDVIVVVSAMGGETDRLISLAHAVAPQPNAREYDALVSAGEQVSAAVVSMALMEKGCDAISFDGAHAGISTNDIHMRASIIGVDPTHLRAALSEGTVPVVTGFQGINAVGDVTTLGRGGSDLTAVAIAAAMNADECQIFTDVAGVYTSDPRVVHNAHLLSEITFEEMLELSGLGAQVLQISAVEAANKASVPLRVLSSFEEGMGTLVQGNVYTPSEPQYSGIAMDANQAKLSILGIPKRPNIEDEIRAAISTASVEVDMMVENHSNAKDSIDFNFTVHLDDYSRLLPSFKEIARDLKARDLHTDEGIAKLSLVGLGMQYHPSVASKILHVLGEEGINIHLITSSEVKISAVIDEKYMELGARSLHSAFGLDNGTQKTQ